MQVYHLTEFVIGELSDENSYVNFALITSIVSVFIIVFLGITCFLFYLLFNIKIDFVARKLGL